MSHVNQHLVEFVEKDECWPAALGLLNSKDPHVKFFVINVVYTKVSEDKKYAMVLVDLSLMWLLG